MKVRLDQEVEETVDRWSADQYVDPSALRRAVEHLMAYLKAHAEELSDGELTHWANVAGLMNRDLSKMETRRRLLSEGLVP